MILELFFLFASYTVQSVEVTTGGATITCDGPPQTASFVLESPPRAVVDFTGGRDGLGPDFAPAAGGPVRYVRSWQCADATRVVFDLARPCSVDALTAGNEVRLLIRPMGTTAARVQTPGGRLSLNVKDAELAGLLRLLSEQFGLNIVLGEDVKTKVTVRFTNVTLDEALEAIIKAAGCDYLRSGDIVIVKPRDKTLPGETVTRVFELSYVDADKVEKSLGKVVSSKGSIQTFVRNADGKRSNTLLVTDTPAAMADVERVIGELDRPVPQVGIEVQFIETLLAANEKMGIDWTVKLRAAGSTLPDFALPIAFSGLQFGTLSFAEFQAVLDLLKSEGRSRLLSNPRVVTLDNQLATLSVGTTVPVRQLSVDPVTHIQTVTYVDRYIPIKLEVTPHATEDGMVLLAVTPSVEAITGWKGEAGDERPITARREATTQVMVRDGETVAIGGLIKESEIQTTRRVWLLGYLPILGPLFRYRTTEKEKTDLLIFITPHVMRP